MATILLIGPLEWEQVTERYIVKFSGQDTNSLRRKCTINHHKLSTGDPKYLPEVREVKHVKMAIGNKAELVGYAKKYDIEVEWEELESDGLVSNVRVSTNSDTNRLLSLHRGRLRVWYCKPVNLYLMDIQAIQNENNSAPREDAREERVEDRRRERNNRRDAADELEDRRHFNMTIATITGESRFGAEEEKITRQENKAK